MDGLPLRRRRTMAHTALAGTWRAKRTSCVGARGPNRCTKMGAVRYHLCSPGVAKGEHNLQRVGHKLTMLSQPAEPLPQYGAPVREVGPDPAVNHRNLLFSAEQNRLETFPELIGLSRQTSEAAVPFSARPDPQATVRPRPAAGAIAVPDEAMTPSAVPNISPGPRTVAPQTTTAEAHPANERAGQARRRLQPDLALRTEA